MRAIALSCLLFAYVNDPPNADYEGRICVDNVEATPDLGLIANSLASSAQLLQPGWGTHSLWAIPLP